MICIGWDVGAWHCDSGKSRDALVALSADPGAARLIGRPWRGNLRSHLRGRSSRVRARILSLLELPTSRRHEVAIAIDTPLGFPAAFRRLLQGGPVEDIAQASIENRYTHRETERFVHATTGARNPPLSTVKDMIGSQATKGLHFLSVAGLAETSTGLWENDSGVTAMETYPTPLRRSRLLADDFARITGHTDWDVVLRRGTSHTADVEDALWCALLARQFVLEPLGLVHPTPDVPDGEGWIWLPRDVVKGPVER